MINIEDNILDNLNYSELSESELKSKFNELKNSTDKNAIFSIVAIVAQLINRTYSYNINKEDIQILNNYINQISTDITSAKAFYPFLIYTILCDIESKQLHCLFIDDLIARKCFDRAALLYNKIGIGAAFNTNININTYIKTRIYSNNIIFSSHKTK